MLFQNWQAFYTLTGTAAASLTGLLFISLTFGVGVALGDVAKSVRIWVEPALNDFVEVLLISCLAMVPGFHPGLYGLILILYNLWRGWRLLEIYKWFKAANSPNDLELADWLEIIIFPGVIYLLLLCCGIGFILVLPWAVNGLA